MCVSVLRSGSAAPSAMSSLPDLWMKRLPALPSAPPVPEEQNTSSNTRVDVCTGTAVVLYRDEGFQKLARPLEDVSVCAETGSISAAVRSEVRLVNTAKCCHQLPEVTCSNLQKTGGEYGLSVTRVVLQEVTLTTDDRSAEQTEIKPLCRLIRINTVPLTGAVPGQKRSAGGGWKHLQLLLCWLCMMLWWLFVKF